MLTDALRTSESPKHHAWGWFPCIDAVIPVHLPARKAGTPRWTAIGSREKEEGLTWHHSCRDYLAKPIISRMQGGSTMPEFVVAIDHITYYAVQAEDEVTAIDLVLEGEGEEISSETRDAYITEYQSSDVR
jgi:hypothetical protein